jgi:hypothetical protein
LEIESDAAKQISVLPWDTKFSNRVHRSPSLISALSHMNPIHALLSHLDNPIDFTFTPGTRGSVGPRRKCGRCAPSLYRLSRRRRNGTKLECWKPWSPKPDSAGRCHSNSSRNNSCAHVLIVLLLVRTGGARRAHKGVSAEAA